MTKSIVLEFDDCQFQRLTQRADELKVDLGELAKAAIDDFVSRPDGDFDRAAKRVLSKNCDLYLRLGQ
jgi:hypothetical protein